MTPLGFFTITRCEVKRTHTRPATDGPLPVLVTVTLAFVVRPTRIDSTAKRARPTSTGAISWASTPPASGAGTARDTVTEAAEVLGPRKERSTTGGGPLGLSQRGSYVTEAGALASTDSVADWTPLFRRRTATNRHGLSGRKRAVAGRRTVYTPPPSVK